MRRHNSLISLSREHHSVLVLAQVLKKDAPNYRGMPTDPFGKAAFALEVFDKTIKKHILLEEKVVFSLVKTKNEKLHNFVLELLQEHQSILDLFIQLGNSDDIMILDKLGRLLESHVRKEERAFFQEIQEALSEVEMQALHEKIQTFQSSNPAFSE